MAEISWQQIDQWLPQTQCTRCGYPSCEAYAKAIATDQADFNRCPPGGESTIRGLASLLGKLGKPLAADLAPYSHRQLAAIDEEVCIGCVMCIKACPVDAIVGSAKHLHTVITDQCTGCELCLEPCPVDCIELVDNSSQPVELHWRWPDYSPDETQRARESTQKRTQRLLAREKQRDSARRLKQLRKADSEQIKQDIAAAVARSRSKRSDG